MRKNIDSVPATRQRSHNEADSNPDEVLKKAEGDILANEERDQIKVELSEWLGEQEIRIKKRLAGFDIGEEETEKLIKQIRKDISTELRMMGSNFEAMQAKIREKLPEINASPDISSEQKSAAGWLAVASRLAFNKMIRRKLRGETSDQENSMLGLISGLIDKNVLGHHDPLAEEIHLSIFNDLKLADYQKVIDHEITHFAFNKKVPQAAYLRLRGANEIKNSKDRTVLSMAFQFSNVLLAINESAAHLVEGRTPDFTKYADQMPTRMFAEVYAAIKNKLADVSKSDYDRFLLDIYDTTANKWREDISFEEIAAIIIDLKK